MGKSVSNGGKVATPSRTPAQQRSAPATYVIDHRPDTARVAQLAELANHGVRARRLRSFSEDIQRKAGQSVPQSAASPIASRGLPSQLRQGTEALSGLDMSDVRVHYDSGLPAQLRALAFAQGNEIHLGVGQERHLPHEAWHVVQQKQGRVSSTRQYAGTPINDDPALESEADRMGGLAAAWTGAESPPGPPPRLQPMAATAGQPLQRRVGLEFQTNVKLKHQFADFGSSLPFKTPLFAKDGWHIESDAGDLEFVTDPVSTYEELDKVMAAVVGWATSLGQLESMISDENEKEAQGLIDMEDPDFVEAGRFKRIDSQERHLASMDGVDGSALAEAMAVGDASHLTAAAQTTVGIPLERIISALHLVAAQKLKLGSPDGDTWSMALGADQERKPTLIPAHDAAVRAVAGLRQTRGDIGETAWRKLEGMIGLAASYVRTANISGRAGYAYIKMVAPMMSRVNFGALYRALPDEVKPMFNSTLLALAAGVEAKDPLFGIKGATRVEGKQIDGPTLQAWADSIIAGHDALSIWGIGEGFGTEDFIGDSESMGQFNALDEEDTVHAMPLVPVELREMTKGLPLSRWRSLAREVMIFSNALIKARFF